MSNETKDFNNSFESIKKLYPNFRITVFTILINTNTTLENITNNLNFDEIMKEVKEVKEVKEIKEAKGLKEKTEFYNSNKIQLNIGESNNISLKIFKNGKIHITGCKTIETIEYLYSFIKSKLNNCDKYQICMINCNFKMNNCDIDKIDLVKLKDNINNKKYVGFESAIYQPCKYQGLKIQHESAKFLVFSVGSVCIISKSIYDIEKAMNDFKALELLGLVHKH